VTEARRGEIWLAAFGEPIGRERGYRRPAVVLSAGDLNRGPAGLVIVVPTTTRHRDLPTHVELDPALPGPQEVGDARCEDPPSVWERRLLRHLGQARPDALFRIGRITAWLLDLPGS
jgi:mRNA interferase MazF